MTTISTRYTAPNGEGELDDNQRRQLGLVGAFGSILIVTIPDLTLPSQSAAIDLLIANPQLIEYENDPHRIGGGANPVVYELLDGTVQSERAFWTHVCEGAPDALRHVERYVRFAIGKTNEFEGIPFDRETGLPGEDALFAFFDTCIVAGEALQSRLSDDEFGVFFKLSYDFVTATDLDHEARLTAFIENLLRRALRGRVAATSFAKFVAYRTSHGQFDLVSGWKEVQDWLLADSGILKLIVDEELSRLKPGNGPLAIADPDYKTDDTEWIADNISDMLDLVYGNDPARDAVHEYVKQHSGIDLQTHVANRSSDYGRCAWAAAMPTRLHLNTGFHDRTNRELGWQDI